VNGQNFHRFKLDHAIDVRCSGLGWEISEKDWRTAASDLQCRIEIVDSAVSRSRPADASAVQ
jgi:hypothetical protein